MEKIIFKTIVISVVLLVVVNLGAKLFLKIRTMYFWKPMIGDVVLKHAMRKNVGQIIMIDGDDFLVESKSAYASSRSWWDKKSVTFLTR